MKKILLTLGLMIGAISMFAQNSNVVFFSDEGTKFYIVINGLRINDQPLSNVRITDVNADYVNAKIVFEDELIPDIEKKTLMLQRGYETSYRLKKNNKGKTVVRWYSSYELAQAPVNQNQRTIVYTQVPPNDGVVVRGGGTTTTTTTTTTSDNVNANVNVGGVHMNVNIDDGMGSSSTTTTTTTTTYSSTSTNGNATYYDNNGGCMYAMSDTEYRDAKNSISSKSFSDSKMTLLKQVVKNNCVNSDQMKGFIQLFDFESDRLEAAKYGYDYVIDPGNYYKVNDAFDFESSIDELNDYMNSRPR